MRDTRRAGQRCRTGERGEARGERLPRSVGLAIAFGIPALALAGTRRASGPVPIAAAALLGLTPWVTLAWVKWGEQRTFASIGLSRPTRATLWFGVAGIAVNLAISGVAGHLNAWLGLREAQSALMGRLIQGSGPLLVLMVSNGALLTEISFRAYGLERLIEALGGRWAALAIQLSLTTALFTLSRGLAHGLVWLVDDFAFSLFYLRRRDTTACVVAHLVPNLVASSLVALKLAS